MRSAPVTIQVFVAETPRDGAIDGDDGVDVVADLALDDVVDAPDVEAVAPCRDQRRP